MYKPSLHVVPYKSGWSLRASGSKRASSTFSTKEEAIDVAKKRAREHGSEVYIYGQDGRIRERSTIRSKTRSLKDA